MILRFGDSSNRQSRFCGLPGVQQSKVGSKDKRLEQSHGIARVINSQAARYRIRRKS
ncbi:unnamed protein product, partial [Staurois parvus]